MTIFAIVREVSMPHHRAVRASAALAAILFNALNEIRSGFPVVPVVTA
jgi:hypothetical protein